MLERWARHERLTIAEYLCLGLMDLTVAEYQGLLSLRGSSPMIDSERFKLLYGPYEVPECKLGDKLLCEYRDREVTVKGMTDALIQWPCTSRSKRRSPIVCGDLVRAIRTESEIAVAHHWGVGYPTVWKWRQALNVPRMTNGSRRLRY